MFGPRESTRLAVLILACFVTAACGGGTEQQADAWPSSSWPEATPESLGLSTEALEAIDRDAREGAYGNVDRLIVIRGGAMALSRRYERDYRAISRGASGPLGCGEGCSDAAWMHDFNYFHPDFHPTTRVAMCTRCSR